MDDDDEDFDEREDEEGAAINRTISQPDFDTTQFYLPTDDQGLNLTER